MGLQMAISRLYTLGYSIRRHFVDDFCFRCVPSLSAGSLVLDLGGHKTAKRGVFDISDYDLRIVYANLSADKGTDVVGDAIRVPVASESFDVVLCTEVLEHVRDPRPALSEVFRVLKRGGTLVMTAPFMHRIHADPCDFGRYTDQYWQSVLSELGFSEVAVEPQGGFYSVILSFAKQYLNQVSIPGPFGRAIRFLSFWLVVAPLQRWALHCEHSLEPTTRSFLTSFTTGYGIRGVKA